MREVFFHFLLVEYGCVTKSTISLSCTYQEEYDSASTVGGEPYPSPLSRYNITVYPVGL
jgi:hypothetical protein